MTSFSARIKRISFSILLLWGMAGCGYHMRGADRPFFRSHGIQKIFVQPVLNNSFKAGVEITMYNAIRKRFAQGGYVKVVGSPEEADAWIEAKVLTANYSPQAITTADKLAFDGVSQGPATVQIASSYLVNLVVDFKLRNRQQTVLWGDSVSRSKGFPASTYMGTLGSTSALINEGEFERTLQDLAVTVATDAEESINSLF
jgi:hypothetical protein